MEWHDWVGNFCYFLLAVSYLVTNMVWLRAIAIVALTLEGIYFYVGSDKPLWVGIFWAFVFVLINAVQLLRIYREHSAVRLSADDKLLHLGVFSELTTVELQRLINIGRWRSMPAGTVLTEENQPVPEVLVMVKGSAKVVVGDRFVASVHAGSLVGEISFVTKQMATATVTALEACRIFAVDAAKLEALFLKHPEMERRVHRVVELDLTTKLTRQDLPMIA
jgi:hypothetical protein